MTCTCSIGDVLRFSLQQLRVSMMAEMDVLIQRTLRQQQEQLGASIALVRGLVTPLGQSLSTYELIYMYMYVYIL